MTIAQHDNARLRIVVETAVDRLILIDAAAPASYNKTVLIVEDEHLVRHFAIKSVRAFGYRTIAAESGEEALGLLSTKSQVDILFTDIVMPGELCGWDLAEQARQILPDLRVVYTSGYAEENLTARKQLPERSVFLGKPYRLAALRRCLQDETTDPAPAA